MLLCAGVPQRLGTSNAPRLHFGEEARNEGTVGRRLLWLAERPAFELSGWCGTCPFLFERLDGANDTASLPELAHRLAEGLDGIDPTVVETYGQLLAEGTYLPILLEVQPRLTMPFSPDDYFSQEQVRTWGIDSFWGLPEYPHTPYYRTFSTPVDDQAHLYEFVVPMAPPTWNDVDRVAHYAEQLAASPRPTAVAVATLDVCAPATDEGQDWYTHWGLTHFLLDGHHKLAAAAAEGRAVRLLSLLAIDASLSTVEQIEQLPALRARQPHSRPTA